MSLDKLRAQVLIVWLVATVLACSIFLVAAGTGYKGVTFQHVKVPVRDLFVAVLPGLTLLLAAYFRIETRSVRLTRGQRRVALFLTYLYAGSFTLISVVMLLPNGPGLNEDPIPPHPAINHYVWLMYLQPLVLAPLAFLFGKGSGNAGPP